MIGKQTKGSSSSAIYEMAKTAIPGPLTKKSIADIGCGKGGFTRWLAGQTSKDVIAVDYDPPEHLELEFKNVDARNADLNEKWPIEDSKVDVVYALEVIEHVENTRHFIREIKRILSRKGYAFISTPNNESLFSRVNFMLSGEHRYFQDSCYPAHINPVLSTEIERICSENNINLSGVVFSGIDVVPKAGIHLSIGGKLFSANIGFRLKVES